MKRIGILSAILASLSLPASGAYQFAPGDVVLTDCHQIYTKGVVNARVDEGYTVHFPKSSGPINCPPFRWHANFVLPFRSVSEYRLKFYGGLKQDVVFRNGETVQLFFEPDQRLIKNKQAIPIEAEITDISDNGAIAVKLLSQDPDAAATFWRWVGRNYIDLRHKALAAEIDKRAR